METRTLQAFLRILYTVNNNPQYILAKSSSKVPTTVCSESTTQSVASESAYARASLKACLVAVCESSPELLQDPTRDFSLYVLDPLEAQPPPTNLAHAPHSTSSPRGVAVALGLMSWALESNDSVNILVTGTIVPNASPALEVIFALRETKRVPKPLHAYPPFGPIPATGSSQPLDPHHPPQARPNQQAQRTLTRSADFPELYIGPPRRAPGRPEGSTSSKSKVKSQASISSLPENSSTELKQEVGTKLKQKTKLRPSRAPSTHSPFICEPLTRNTTADPPGVSATGAPASYQQSYPFGPNQNQFQAQNYPQNQPFAQSQSPILELLSAISSATSGSTGANSAPLPQAALLSALQGLLVSNPHPLQLAMTNVGPTTITVEQATENKPVRVGSKAKDEDDDTDSDIVILDSSTVDTTAFYKPSYRKPATNGTDIPAPSQDQDSAMLCIQNTVPSPLAANTHPSGQKSTAVSPQTSTIIASPEVKTPTPERVSWERSEGENIPSQAPDIPATPTPSRVRKRKLDVYIYGQAHSPAPSSPPSASPSAARSTKRTLTARRALSSPTCAAKPMPSPSARLPSMLGSLRKMTVLATRLQTSPSGSSTHGRPASSLGNRNGGLSTSPLSGPLTLKVDLPETTTAFRTVVADTTSLKRRLNLNLNEVMEEQEARKNAKHRKRPSSRRNLEGEVPACASQAGPSHSSQLASTSRQAQSSPPRPSFKSNSVAPTWQPGLAPDTGISNPPPLSTSVGTTSASTSTAAQSKNPLKHFVMPAWARTSTAMLPRLSEETLARRQAEREAKKAQVSLRRRESAKAKRKRKRDAECPSKESSDEDDDAIADGLNQRLPHPSSSGALRAPLAPPPPSLPVFASDAVAPISSPPQMHSQPPPVPSTPPRKPVSPASALHRTPNKPGSCSLFTPSGQESGSLFTPSTPSVTQSITRTTFTPRSPTVLLRSGVRISPRKSAPQTPWTPKRNGASLQTPRNLCSGRNAPFTSPSLATRTPQMRMGMGSRAFLLPPPSPSTSRTPRHENQMFSKELGSVIPAVTEDSGIMKQELPDRQDVHQVEGSKGGDIPIYEPDGAHLEADMSAPPANCSPTRPTADDRLGTSELGDIASSPLPPSSPLPASPFSSPAKRHDSDLDTLPIGNLVVPDSDILLPSASDSDRRKGIMDTNWLSDDAYAPSWLTESEASAWFTETDTEGGGPLPTDSDGAWLSDSDVIFGDMSSLPPSSASNWFSDDADVDTDGEGGAGAGAIVRPDGTFDTATFERAFASLVERGVRNDVGKEESAGGGATGTLGAKPVDSEFWELIWPLLAESAVDGAGSTSGNLGESVEENKVAHDLQALLNELVGS